MLKIKRVLKYFAGQTSVPRFRVVALYMSTNYFKYPEYSSVNYYEHFNGNFSPFSLFASALLLLLLFSICIVVAPKAPVRIQAPFLAAV